MVAPGTSVCKGLREFDLPKEVLGREALKFTSDVRFWRLCPDLLAHLPGQSTTDQGSRRIDERR
jgi:hypothetical protein